MKLYTNLKLKGIETSEDFVKQTKGCFLLDDIHFKVPCKNNSEKLVDAHLDFNILDFFFDNDSKEVILRMKELANTWDDLNEEDSDLKHEDITIELLEQGYLDNYIISIQNLDDSYFTDITITKIGYLDDMGNPVLLKISPEAVNEADLEF